MTITTPDPTKADVNWLGYVGSKPTERLSNEWYTPTPYLDSVRACLGGIDLDPMSSAHANTMVNANRFFTEEDDAFKQSWDATTVFMNPPYSGYIVGKAMHMFMDEYAAGKFKGGIILVNNATETRWFQRALDEANAMCLTNHRIAFWNADGKKVSGNTRGQAFLLFGPTYTRSFKKHFTTHGKVLTLA